VATSKSGNDVTISIRKTGSTTTVASRVVTFEKNMTRTYDVGGYTVEVKYNGSGVNTAVIKEYPGSQTMETKSVELLSPVDDVMAPGMDQDDPILLSPHRLTAAALS